MCEQASAKEGRAGNRISVNDILAARVAAGLFVDEPEISASRSAEEEDEKASRAAVNRDSQRVGDKSRERLANCTAGVVETRRGQGRRRTERERRRVNEGDGRERFMAARINFFSAGDGRNLSRPVPRENNRPYSYGVLKGRGRKSSA